MTKLLIAALLIGAAGPAAAENAMKLCGAKYRAAKADGSLLAGQSWLEYLKACRASLPKADPAPANASAAAPKGGGAGSRMHECAGEYRADKAAGKLGAGETWPKYYGACAKRHAGG